jgi:hypothetical protein
MLRIPAGENYLRSFRACSSRRLETLASGAADYDNGLPDLSGGYRRLVLNGSDHFPTREAPDAVRMQFWSISHSRSL